MSKTKQEKHILLKTCTSDLSFTKQNRKTHFTQDLHSWLVTHKTKQKNTFYSRLALMTCHSQNKTEKHISLKTCTRVLSLTKNNKRKTPFTQDSHSCLVTHKTKQKNTFYSSLALMSSYSQNRKNTFYSRLALLTCHSQNKTEKHILLKTCTHVSSLTKPKNKQKRFTRDLHSWLPALLHWLHLPFLASLWICGEN